MKLITDTARGYGDRLLQTVAEAVGELRMPLLTRIYLYEILYPSEDTSLVVEEDLPLITEKLDVLHSAVAYFYSPSDSAAGLYGLKKERIRSSNRSWRGGMCRRDCVLVESDPEKPGFRGLFVARVHCFFKIKYHGISYPSALVYWFTAVGEEPDPLTGMWIVEPEMDPEEPARQLASVIHLDSILRAVHLIPSFGGDFIPDDGSISPENSLDLFKEYYVNKYADHHSHESLF